MLPVKFFEFGITGISIEYMIPLRVVQARKKVLPDRFLKRIRTFSRNLYTVLVRPFSALLASTGNFQITIPENRRHDERKIAVSMGAHAGEGRQFLQLYRRTRACQPGDKNRPVNVLRGKFRVHQTCFKVADPLH